VIAVDSSGASSADSQCNPNENLIQRFPALGTVFIRTSFIGFHCWPDAPDSESYLRHLHRHTFGVRVEHRAISDNVRGIEFHQLRKATDHVLANEVQSAMDKDHSLSCEEIAKVIAEGLYLQGYRPGVVEVDEDGECGGAIYPDYLKLHPIPKRSPSLDD